MEKYNRLFSNRDQLKEFLELKYIQYNKIDFIESDPILIPHQFTQKEDIEISAFFAATIAWGKRSIIIRNAEHLMNLMDNSPFDFITNHKKSDLNQFKEFKHRTFNYHDCLFFIERLQWIYKTYGNLENSFFENEEINIPQNINHFKKIFMGENLTYRSSKHIADPLKGSSAKRINMFLRWMIRKDSNNVDFGIWSKAKPSDLYCPLDVHSGRVARRLGLLQRKQNDWKAVSELNKNLKEFDKKDPVKYDYALFGLGIYEGF